MHILWEQSQIALLLIFLHFSVSDRCSRGEAEDKSGPNLNRLLQSEQRYDIMLSMEDQGSAKIPPPCTPSWRASLPIVGFCEKGLIFHAKMERVKTIKIMTQTTYHGGDSCFSFCFPLMQTIILRFLRDMPFSVLDILKGSLQCSHLISFAAASLPQKIGNPQWRKLRQLRWRLIKKG